MSNYESTDRANGESLGSLLTGLVSEPRRLIVSYFMVTDAAIASVANLGEYVHAELEDESVDSVERAMIQLHHVDLPKLAETGVLDYDPRTRTVRYAGEPTLENIQEYLDAEGD